MIQTAVADVVGPAVTADDPVRFLDQVVCNIGETLGNNRVTTSQSLFQGSNPVSLCFYLILSFLGCRGKFLGSLFGNKLFSSSSF